MLFRSASADLVVLEGGSTAAPSGGRGRTPPPGGGTWEVEGGGTRETRGRSESPRGAERREVRPRGMRAGGGEPAAGLWEFASPGG